MKQSIRYTAHGALIAAMYVALTHLQNVLLPGSATWAIQFRVSEALCVLTFFSPAAVAGLTVGCFLFNLTYAGALPLDAPLGSLATLLAAWGMYSTRRITVKGLPLLGLCLPGLTNALLVGWELSVYVGGGFFINALYVAIGELAVLLSLGSMLYGLLKRRNLGERIFRLH